jgi:hypothetical protein
MGANNLTEIHDSPTRENKLMMRMFFFTGVSYELLLRYDLGEFLVDIDLVVSCIAVWTACT